MRPVRRSNTLEHLFLIANLTTSKAFVTSSDALAPSSFLFLFCPVLSRLLRSASNETQASSRLAIRTLHWPIQLPPDHLRTTQHLHYVSNVFLAFLWLKRRCSKRSISILRDRRNSSREALKRTCKEHCIEAGSQSTV